MYRDRNQLNLSPDVDYDWDLYCCDIKFSVNDDVDGIPVWNGNFS